ISWRLKRHKNGVWLTQQGQAQESASPNKHNGRKFMLRMKSIVAGFGLAALLSTSAAFAGDAASCKKVRLSDVGWTD
ncbi:hypothetical protein, partial [Klebsiella variicola]|uniref:hypothetical protein n=1 Tax=Klebsiella variicola TaxID=244366 RepID=UPI00273089A8